MALQCDLDLNLKALETAKADLKTQLALPDVDVSAIKDKADAQLASLKASIPEVPEIPDFQKEFDELKTSILSGVPSLSAISDLQNRWGDAIPDISSVTAVLNDPISLVNIDPCSKDAGIPDIAGEVDAATGKLVKVEKPPVAKDLTDDSAKLPKKIETAVTKETSIKVSSVRGSDLTSLERQTIGMNAWAGPCELPIYKDLVNDVHAAMKAHAKAKKTYDKKFKRGLPDIPDNIRKEYKEKGLSSFNYYILNNKKLPKQYETYANAISEYKCLHKIYTIMGDVWKLLKALNTTSLAPYGKSEEENQTFLDSGDIDIALKQRIFDVQFTSIHTTTTLLPEAAAKIGDINFFKIDTNDYTSPFVFTLYTADDFIFGGEGKKNTKYKNAYKETLDHLYDTKAFLRTPNRELLEHQQSFNLDIPKADVVLWNKNDILPESLGGNLKQSV